MGSGLVEGGVWKVETLPNYSLLSENKLKKE